MQKAGMEGMKMEGMLEEDTESGEAGSYLRSSLCFDDISPKRERLPRTREDFQMRAFPSLSIAHLNPHRRRLAVLKSTWQIQDWGGRPTQCLEESLDRLQPPDSVILARVHPY